MHYELISTSFCHIIIKYQMILAFLLVDNERLNVLRPGDGHWGTWTEWSSCPKNSYARSFRLRLERKQGGLYDDSGLNAVQIKCEDIYGTETRCV